MNARSSCGLSCEIFEPIAGAAVLRGGAFRPVQPWLGTARAGTIRQLSNLHSCTYEPLFSAFLFLNPVYYMAL